MTKGRGGKVNFVLCNACALFVFVCLFCSKKRSKLKLNFCLLNNPLNCVLFCN